MNLVLLTHPAFLGLTSQMLFARSLVNAFRQRGHAVELRQPQALLRRRASGRLAKWAGYADQYLLFPGELRRRAATDAADTLYVFCDQALGPWVPLLAHRPHVVHCHDLLALRSALGQVPENPTSATGRAYQHYIRAGFRHARHFISISERTRADLHQAGGVRASTSDVVHNGLNHPYRRLSQAQARDRLRQAGLPSPQQGMVLHVGGGQWYKNSAGVVHLYARFADRCTRTGRAAPALWMVSPEPGSAVRQALSVVPAAGEVRFFQDLSADTLEALYSLADAMLFPSLAEGFGWPIAEALACGCPVVTTAETPMTEVGGPCAHYLPRLRGADDLPRWAEAGAALLASLLDRPAAERDAAALAGIEWTRRFDADRAIDAYLRIYQSVLARSAGSSTRITTS